METTALHQEESNPWDFSGEIGPYLKLLAWVFSSDCVLPYYTLSWRDGLVECKVSAKEYLFSLGIGHHRRRQRGIDTFPVAFTDRSIEENFEDMKFQVHYFNHDYTVANLRVNVESSIDGSMCLDFIMMISQSTHQKLIMSRGCMITSM